MRKVFNFTVLDGVTLLITRSLFSQATTISSILSTISIVVSVSGLRIDWSNLTAKSWELVIIGNSINPT